MTSYFVFRMLVAFILGAAWYVADRWFGVGLYRRWHDMTSQHPMTGQPDRGLVYNRPAKARAFWAVVIASLVTLLSYFGGSFSPLLEMALWAAAVPAAFLGLLIGPRLYGLWQKRDTAFDAVDKWERGEVDISDGLKSRTVELGSRIKKSITSAPDEAAADPRPADASPAPPVRPLQPDGTAPSSPQQPAAPPPESAPADPQELVNRYLNRGRNDKNE